jgi:hypothetical protein
MQRARKAYGLWAENPFHPSLHFKCVNSEENIWSSESREGIDVSVFWMATPSLGFGLAAIMTMSGSSRDRISEGV